MKSLNISFLCLALLGLSACATAGAGYQVEHKDSAPVARLQGQDGGQGNTSIRSVQEPWHNIALTGDVTAFQEVGAAYVRLNADHPWWQKELTDLSRTYKVPEGKGFSIRPLKRAVFRAVVYRDGQFTSVHDAVITPDGRRFLVLFPPSGRESYPGDSLLIASHTGHWVMTTQGKMVELPKKANLESLGQGFFSENPSPLPQIHSLRRTDSGGRLLFAELEQLFPYRFSLRGVMYSGRPDTAVVAAQFTRADTPADRLISCGGVPVSFPFSLPATAIGAATSGYKMATGCFKGDKH